MLHDDHPVIYLCMVIVNVPAAIRPLTDIRALKGCTYGQHDIGKLRIPFVKYGLINYEFYRRITV